MHFVLLLLLAVACIPRSWPQPLGWFDLPGNALAYSALTWGGVLGFVILARLLANRTCRQLRLRPGIKEEVLYRYAQRRRRHQRLLNTFLILSVYGLGWGWTAQTLCTFESTGMLPLAELLVIAPFLVAVVLSWALFYDVELTVHQTSFYVEPEAPFWSRGEYVRFHFRQQFGLVGAAILMLMGMKGLLRVFPSLEDNEYFGVGMLLMMPLVVCLLPLGLRILLGWRAMPAGPLRERLEACAQRLGFRYRDILVWETRGTIATAMVAGMLPFLRYVMITDQLLHGLTPVEVDAVFGHEIGHVKHWHMWFYMWFLIVSILVVAGLSGLAASALFPETSDAVPVAATENEAAPTQAAARLDFDLALRELRQVLPLMTILGAYIFVVFGFLSRRCERQADIYGCRAVSCARAVCPGHEVDVTLAPGGRGLCHSGIRTFISALEKVATLNGISRHRPGLLQSWQHSTIARRVEFLQRVLEDPTLEARFQRAVTVVKWAVLLTLCAVLVALCESQGWSRIGK